MARKTKLNKSGNPVKARPHTWKYGTDEFKHSMHQPFLQARAQAKFRNEEWNLTFDEFYDLWEDRWIHRGKNSVDYCMTRDEPTGAWEKKNVLVMTRYEQLIRSRNMQISRGKKS